MTKTLPYLAIDWHRAGLAILSGILLTFAFPTFDLELLAWLAFIPLLAAFKDQSIKNAFWLGLGAGIVHFLGTLYWVTVAMAVYGNLPKSVSVGLLVIQVVFLALYFGAFGMIVRYIHLHTCIPLVVSAPVAWTALEYGRTYFFLGFPWNLLGYTQYLTPSVIQIADITGVYGVSFLVMFVNAGLYTSLLTAETRAFKITTAFVTVGCIGACIGYGFMTLSAADHQAAEEIETIRVAVVQGNIDQGIKWDESYRQHILDTYFRLSAETLEGHPDLIIWPETAVPFVFKFDPLYREQLVREVRKWNTPLLFGGQDIQLLSSPHQYNALNSAFLLSSQGELVAQYDKIQLVPFGEYVPFKKLLFFVKKMVEVIGEIVPGTSYTVMPFRDTPFSTVICFESIFPNLVRKFVDSGARFLVIITNDAWYGRSSAPYQHFAMATLRAVENRISIARAANTGISGFIDPYGRILVQNEIFVEDALVYDIPISQTTTVYTRYGDVFAIICLVLTMVWIGKAWYNNCRTSRSKQSEAQDKRAE